MHSPKNGTPKSAPNPTEISVAPVFNFDFQQQNNQTSNGEQPSEQTTNTCKPNSAHPGQQNQPNQHHTSQTQTQTQTQTNQEHTVVPKAQPQNGQYIYIIDRNYAPPAANGIWGHVPCFPTGSNKCEEDIDFNSSNRKAPETQYPNYSGCQYQSGQQNTYPFYVPVVSELEELRSQESRICRRITTGLYSFLKSPAFLISGGVLAVSALYGFYLNGYDHLYPTIFNWSPSIFFGYYRDESKVIDKHDSIKKEEHKNLFRQNVADSHEVHNTNSYEKSPNGLEKIKESYFSQASILSGGEPLFKKTTSVEYQETPKPTSGQKPKTEGDLKANPKGNLKVETKTFINPQSKYDLSEVMKQLQKSESQALEKMGLFLSQKDVKQNVENTKTQAIKPKEDIQKTTHNNGNGPRIKATNINIKDLLK